VLPATARLPGERNGQRFGMQLNTAVRNAGDKKQSFTKYYCFYLHKKKSINAIFLI
jgi:hypothetical protein